MALTPPRRASSSSGRSTRTPPPRRSTASSTPSRPSEQEQVRIVLAEALKAVVAQLLLRKKGGGRVPAFEILLGSSALSERDPRGEDGDDQQPDPDRPVPGDGLDGPVPGRARLPGRRRGRRGLREGASTRTTSSRSWRSGAPASSQARRRADAASRSQRAGRAAPAGRVIRNAAPPRRFRASRRRRSRRGARRSSRRARGPGPVPPSFVEENGTKSFARGLGSDRRARCPRRRGREAPSGVRSQRTRTRPVLPRPPPRAFRTRFTRARRRSAASAVQDRKVPLDGEPDAPARSRAPPRRPPRRAPRGRPAPTWSRSGRAKRRKSPVTRATCSASARMRARCRRARLGVLRRRRRGARSRGSPRSRCGTRERCRPTSRRATASSRRNESSRSSRFTAVRSSRKTSAPRSRPAGSATGTAVTASCLAPGAVAARRRPRRASALPRRPRRPPAPGRGHSASRLGGRRSERRAIEAERLRGPARSPRRARPCGPTTRSPPGCDRMSVSEVTASASARSFSPPPQLLRVPPCASGARRPSARKRRRRRRGRRARLRGRRGPRRPRPCP